MSIFGKIMSAIFGSKADAAPAGGGAAAEAGSSGGAAAPAATVDVAPILDKAVAAKGEKLAWRTSIVDLMKALDIWLHKQVMAKLAANGGKLPPDIKH